jgi:hypothetical protein
MDDKKLTRGDSCWRALAYQTRVRVGGKMLSRTEAREGGAVGEGEVGRRRWGETGRETTRVARVMAEIHREESRGSSDEGNRDQKLHQQRQR